MTSSQKRGKHSSRAKINRMVADGTKNYPSYLKLIYTGDSEFSSEDEGVVDTKRFNQRASLPLHSDQPSQASVNSSFDYKTCSDDRKTDDSSNHSTPKKIESLAITEVLTSPESDKLKDEGKEKAATPVTVFGQQLPSPSTQPTHLFSNQTFPMAGSWHAFNNDKIVLNEDNHVEKMELERELLQIQDEISSLRSVLDTKVALATQLKKRLGVSAMWEIKQGLATFKQSHTYQKTNAAWKSLGGMASRTITSIKSSRSFFKTPQLQDTNHFKQSMSMADMSLTQANLKASRSANNVSAP